MKSPRDTGYSPNERFNKDPKTNAIPLTNGDVIRIVTDYDKVIKVRNIMIRIQDLRGDDPEGRMFYTIWDEKLAHRLNRTGVRVRMVRRDPSHVYLFEPQTDTYLGCIPRDLQPAGDAANATDEDKNRYGEFYHKKNHLAKYRKDLSKQEEADIKAENEIHDMNALPETLSESLGIVIPADERHRREPPNASCKEVGETTPKSTAPRTKRSTHELEEVAVIENQAEINESELELA